MPELRLNLISDIALDKQGYESFFGKSTWKLMKSAMVVARGHICGNLYKTHVKVCSDSLNIMEREVSQNMWHQRLGHMSEKGLSILTKKQLISMAKNLALDPCNHFLFGKQRRVSFTFSFTRKSELLSLVHSDICGPMEVESLGGNRYFLTFIDDASRKV